MLRFMIALGCAVFAASCAMTGAGVMPRIRSLEEEPPPRPWAQNTEALVNYLRTGVDCTAIRPATFEPYNIEISQFRYHLTNRQGRPQYALTRDFDFVVHLPAAPKRREQHVFIRVPRGFVTDFYSIPEGLRGFVSGAGNYAEASVLHDWLYAVGEHGDKPGQRFADDVLLHAMLQLGAPEGLARNVYAGVSGGGAKGFGRPWELRFYDSRPSVRVSYLPASSQTRAALHDASTCVFSPGAVAEAIASDTVPS
jgi:hypothetical protein